MQVICASRAPATAATENEWVRCVLVDVYRSYEGHLYLCASIVPQLSH